MHFSTLFLSATALLPSAFAQLSGPVGPRTKITDRLTKRATCDVTQYGAKADKTTDIGPPLASAWAACQSGGTVVIPKGDYAMKTWVELKNGKGVKIQLDGVIYRTGTAGGNMFMIRDSQDFELYSSTGKGAIQGTWPQSPDCQQRTINQKLSRKRLPAARSRIPNRRPHPPPLQSHRLLNPRPRAR